VFIAQNNGWLEDINTLSFQVFDVSDDTKALNPVQVYPAVPGDKATIDVDNDCPTGGRLGLGRYAATWALASDLAFGKHEIRWFWKRTATSAEQTVAAPVEILASAGVLQNTRYASVSDIRAEGVLLADATDARVQLAIISASKYIEKVTGRVFEAQYKTLKVDGRGSHVLLLHEPIIAVELIQLSTSIVSDSYILPEDSDSYRIYNRHMNGMVVPDDRNNPRIELYIEERLPGLSYTFMKGSQNIEVTGVFGYTDPDGSPFGQTPELIKRACVMLVMRDIWKLTDIDKREDYIRRHRIVSERTRDQAYTLSPLQGSSGSSGGSGGGRFGGAFTGDPEVDRILALYVRPPLLGAA
jgi:hypothetical protein